MLVIKPFIRKLTELQIYVIIISLEFRLEKRMEWIPCWRCLQQTFQWFYFVRTLFITLQRQCVVCHRQLYDKYKGIIILLLVYVQAHMAMDLFAWQR